MITFESVSKHYQHGPAAVADLTMELPAGRITVLVGPSGCGKSTTMRMINRLVTPSSGRVLLDGQDTASLSPAALRRGIGYVIQHSGLFPHRTVLGNVTAVPRLLGWNRKRSADRAEEVLAAVGLDPSLSHRYPAQLSGGQQQRVGVARALAADPPVMLMDEPFSAVDPVVRGQLQDELLRLQGELGKTIVLVTHDIDEAIKLGDEIVVMAKGGRLAQKATPAELLSRPADDFVAGFIGTDRGYRALGFAPAAGLPLREEPSVRLGRSLDEARRHSRDDWVLVVDDSDAPLGWLHVGGARGSTEIRRGDINLGGTLASLGGSRRAALDAALSSPCGRGVVIDADGRLAGTITAAEVLAG